MGKKSRLKKERRDAKSKGDFLVVDGESIPFEKLADDWERFYKSLPEERSMEKVFSLTDYCNSTGQSEKLELFQRYLDARLIPPASQIFKLYHGEYIKMLQATGFKDYGEVLRKEIEFHQGVKRGNRYPLDNAAVDDDYYDSLDDELCGDCAVCPLSRCLMRSVSNGGPRISVDDIADVIGEIILRKYKSGIGLPESVFDRFKGKRNIEKWEGEVDDVSGEYWCNVDRLSIPYLNVGVDKIDKLNIPLNISENYDDCIYWNVEDDECDGSFCQIRFSAVMRYRNFAVAGFSLKIIAWLVTPNYEEEVVLFKDPFMEFPEISNDGLVFPDEVLRKIQEAVWK